MSQTPVTTLTPAMAPTPAALLPGWYGKLPHLGDFASRRLPDAFIVGWDAWLGQALAVSRQALGGRWLAGYLVAPIVRFWLAPGLLGAGAWAGLVMPSVDRVGRHFPLTVAQAGVPLAQAQAAPGWFAALDAAMRLALDVDFTVDDLERTLAQAVRHSPLPAPAGEAAAPEAAAGSLWWFPSAGGELRCHFDALPPVQALSGLLGACA
ncbi:type VI secretion system-associated protein TagF [Azohydromonas lata]|uniref:Type VI secretion system-associated protein TagF n=1 Tax=Azohydromonas lata TaxID=45677 RepID=A0ABU5IRI8_9BURK|nr:type VI secretion system-associated protein TagF [Azohydromonas lata]MDZ5461490.1 type VI secretion system-associated protein TagF [Azohydromonas lata]